MPAFDDTANGRSRAGFRRADQAIVYTTPVPPKPRGGTGTPGGYIGGYVGLEQSHSARTWTSAKNAMMPTRPLQTQMPQSARRCECDVKSLRDATLDAGPSPGPAQWAWRSRSAPIRSGPRIRAARCPGSSTGGATRRGGARPGVDDLVASGSLCRTHRGAARGALAGTAGQRPCSDKRW